jgi:DNA-binding response OmpR family regulator
MAKVLIIDDNRHVHLALGELLNHFGHEPSHATTLIETLSEFRLKVPDIVLLDLDMPAVPGVACGRVLRQLRGEKFGLIIHSAASHDELTRASNDLQADAILPKGSTPAAIQSFIANVLARRRRAQYESLPAH